jgi:hypothetical protein
MGGGGREEFKEFKEFKEFRSSGVQEFRSSEWGSQSQERVSILELRQLLELLELLLFHLLSRLVSFELRSAFFFEAHSSFGGVGGGSGDCAG